MTALEKLEVYLDERNMPFTHSVHPRAFTAQEVAQAEFISSRGMAKPVTVLADGAFALAVVAADSTVDLPQLRRLMDVNHLRLATEEEIKNLFPDCEVGAMPPLGNLYGLPVLVDSNLALQDVIAFNAGTHSDVVHMKFEDFRKAVDPEILPFGRRFGERKSAIELEA